MRSGELGALKVKDIQWDNKALDVCRTWIRGNKIKESTKGSHDDLLPLSQKALEIVSKHAEGKGPEDWLFTNLHSRPYTPKHIYEIWVYWRGEEFEGITEHELIRHSYCTQLAAAGATGFLAQKLMRHKDIATTNKYVHLPLESLREFVEKRSLDKV